MHDTKYKGMTFAGSWFPDAPYNNDIRITFTPEMMNEYIPTINRVMKDYPKGFKLLLIIMTSKEGFREGSRSHRNNNPGNIGNTDSGANRTLPTLEDGIRLQIDYIERIVSGRHRSYPIGQRVQIRPFFSREIGRNPSAYKMSPWVPGYDFVFTGQIDQFVKIYSTGARAGNTYINLILSYFKNHGIKITPETTIQEIIAIK